MLIDIADREFKREKEDLRREYEKRGLDTSAFDVVDTPSQLERLKAKLDSLPTVKRSTTYTKTYPSGKVKLSHYSSQDDDISSWYSREFNTQEDMINFLYEKAEFGTPREKKEAEKILNQLFRKLKSVGKIKYSGNEG